MDENVVIQVKNLSKKFTTSIKRSMLYGTTDVMKSMFGLKQDTEKLRKGEFWALENINFDLKKGETIGLLGENGSGKSTLLRIINGIFPPDAGSISIKGKMGALIALGAGFHPHLTGRENIYLNGVILGMSKKEIEGKYMDIVDFADIGQFIDNPVSTYSSGMKVRLGFAIAINADVDILLADEILAVGDVNFQKKCFEKILDLRAKGISTIFVSHSISQLERICDKGLLIHHGNQIYFGEVREAVKKYMDILYSTNKEKAAERRKNRLSVGVGNFEVDNVKIYQEGKLEPTTEIEFEKNITIEFDYLFKEKTSEEFQIRLAIRTYEGHDVQKFVVQEVSYSDNIVYENERIAKMPQKGKARLTIKNQRLFPQTFLIDIAAQSLLKSFHEGGTSNIAEFRIVEPQDRKVYFEYGNMTITEFDYDFELSKDE